MRRTLQHNTHTYVYAQPADTPNKLMVTNFLYTNHGVYIVCKKLVTQENIRIYFSNKT